MTARGHLCGVELVVQLNSAGCSCTEIARSCGGGDRLEIGFIRRRQLAEAGPADRGMGDRQQEST